MDDRHNLTPENSVGEFLGRKGAVELVCEIDREGSRFTDLVNELGVSRTTVSNRLQEGVEVGLFEREANEGGDRSHRYALTDRGVRLRLAANLVGLPEKHYFIKQLRREFDEKSRELRKWVTDSEKGENPLDEPVDEDVLKDFLG